MKKFVLKNLVIIFVFVFSIISFGLLIPPCQNYWGSYKTWGEYCKNWEETTGETDGEAKKMQDLSHSLALECTFAAVFSGLTAVSSVVIFIEKNKTKKDVE